MPTAQDRIELRRQIGQLAVALQLQVPPTDRLPHRSQGLTTDRRSEVHIDTTVLVDRLARSERIAEERELHHRMVSTTIDVLGVPTVADRVAQTAVKLLLEPQLDPLFHDDSYGYRPGRSALDAVGIVRRRCWQYDWVVEFDIKGLFDNIDHALLLRAVRKHCQIPWVLLYVERWLTAPMLFTPRFRCHLSAFDT